MDVIHGPVQGYAGVTDVPSYRAVHELAMQNKGVRFSEVDTPRSAYINHGRWVVDCLCAGAGLTSRSFGLSCCFDCGRVYTAITFPKHGKAIEDLLLARPPDARNWRDESLAVLRDENAKEGVS